MKERKPTTGISRDPALYDEDFNPQNLLSLPEELRRYLTDQNLDWRFMNSAAFRNAGGYHHSQFRPFQVKPEMGSLGVTVTTAEGLIQRGDLILGVRSKTLTSKYRELKEKRNQALKNFGRVRANEMREDAARKGLGEHVRIKEGYDEDEAGFKGE